MRPSFLLRPAQQARDPLKTPTADPSSSPAATACLAGALAGILGLTNLAGFALYLAASVSVGGAYSLAQCGAKPARFFVKPSEPILAGTLGNCFSFILFWTRACRSLFCFVSTATAARVEQDETDALRPPRSQSSTRSSTVRPCSRPSPCRPSFGPC